MPETINNITVKFGDHPVATAHTGSLNNGSELVLNAPTLAQLQNGTIVQWILAKTVLHVTGTYADQGNRQRSGTGVRKLDAKMKPTKLNPLTLHT